MLQFFSIKCAFLSLQRFKNTFKILLIISICNSGSSLHRGGVSTIPTLTQGGSWKVCFDLYLHRACWCFDFSSLIFIFQEWCVWCLRWFVGYCHFESTLSTSLTKKLNVFFCQHIHQLYQCDSWGESSLVCFSDKYLSWFLKRKQNRWWYKYRQPFSFFPVHLLT